MRAGGGLGERGRYAREAGRDSVVDLALGRQTAEAVVARARTDGSSAVSTVQEPAGAGLWAPTPPAFVTQPLEPLAGTWRPWNLSTGSQLRPPPPPRPGSVQFETELRDVYTASLALTAEQKAIALHWADGAGTVTPPGHWNEIALSLIRSHDLSEAAAAHVLATLDTAQADAFIACWDAKYAYWSVRPVTAIRQELDPTWLPLIPTPPFPSYVSGHSTTSGAASEVLAHYFPESAAQLRGMAEEAAISRLYGGIHFQFDNEAGLALGRSVAGAAFAASRGVPRWLGG